VDDPGTAIDVLHSQPAGLADAKASPVCEHQHRTQCRGAQRSEQPLDLAGRQHRWQCARLLATRQVHNDLRPLQHLRVEKPERRSVNVVRLRAEMLVLDQVQEVAPHVLAPEPGRARAEVTLEPPDAVRVRLARVEWRTA
jgi:hypothetical protein